MAWYSNCANLRQSLRHINKYLLFPLFSLGKMDADGIIAALIGVVKNKVFYVDEGFADYRELRIKRIEAARRHPVNDEERPPTPSQLLEKAPLLEAPLSDQDA